MNKKGPVIVIEDDEDDMDMLKEIFLELNYINSIVFFKNGEDALVYLNTPILPFLILSDINMPKMDGVTLKQKIHASSSLRAKCIPYLFFTTCADPGVVTVAYKIHVQGFFVKPDSYLKIKSTVQLIMAYWKECITPVED